MEAVKRRSEEKEVSCVKGELLWLPVFICVNFVLCSCLSLNAGIIRAHTERNGEQVSPMKLTLVFLDCYNGVYNTVLYPLETL